VHSKSRNTVTAILRVGLLMTVIAVATSANAEMSKVDTAGKNTFKSCLEQTVGDKERCLLKLGFQSWYPYGDAACMSVAASVQTALAETRQIEWMDLFRNERCARLDMPHNTTAAKAGGTEAAEIPATQPYVSCMKEVKGLEICLERVGRHTWYPIHFGCHRLNDILEGDLQLFSWMLLFFNERCARLKLPYYRPSDQ